MPENFPIQRDDYAEYQMKPIYPPIRTDKKANVNYWDAVENIVQEAFINVAQAGGVVIHDLLELIDVKEITEDMVKRIEKQFPKAEFPYVDQDF